METAISVSPPMYRFLDKNGTKRIGEICQNLKDEQVKITISKGKLSISGTEVGLSKGKMRLQQLMDQIEKKEHILKKPGIFKLMTSDEGKEKICRVEEHNNVVMEHSTDSDASDEGGTRAGSPDSQRGKLVKEVARCSQKGYQFLVMFGDVTELQVDVLVNAANKELNHVGGLAKAIVKKGGRSIQVECNDYIKKNGKLMDGDTFTSKPGALKCSLLVHAVAPVWRGGKNDEEELLEEAVQKCVDEANDNGHSSIAIPALGAGIFGVPHKIATSTIIQAVESHFKENENSNVRDIYLCDVSKDITTSFTKSLQKRFGADQVSITAPSSDSRKWSPQKQIKQPDDDEEDYVVVGHAAGPSSQIDIKIIKGQIAKMKSDVIVNTTSKDLNLSNGAVSGSILKEAGAQIQAECAQNYPSGVNHGDVAVTQGYNLNCQFVCHGALPGWDGGTGAALQILKAFILNCLKTGDQKQLTSLAFPAMGTGNLRYPRDVVATTMYTMVEMFAVQNPNCSLNKVSFVIYDRDSDTIKAFEKIEKKYNRGAYSGDGGGESGATGGRRHNFEGSFNPQGGSCARDQFTATSQSEMPKPANNQSRRFPTLTTNPGTKMSVKQKPRYARGRSLDMILARTKSDSEDINSIARPEDINSIVRPESPDIFSPQSKMLSEKLTSQGDGTRTKNETSIYPKLISHEPVTHTHRQGRSRSECVPNNPRQFHRLNTVPTLTSKFDQLLSEKYMLTDRDIDRAMRLVRRQNPNVSGLQDISVVACMGGHKMFDKYTGNFIQICHTGRNHWVTMTNIHCTAGSVRIYDSFYRTQKKSLKDRNKHVCVTDQTKLDISCIVPAVNQHISVILPKYQQQTTKYECGLFAIASLSLLVNSGDPSSVLFDCSRMRSHLKQCFVTKVLSEFPVLMTNVPQDSLLPEEHVKLTLCCSCDISIISSDNVITCMACRRLCHDKRSCTGNVSICKQCVR